MMNTKPISHPPRDWSELQNAAGDVGTLQKTPRAGDAALRLNDLLDNANPDLLDVGDLVGQTALHVAAQQGSLVAITMLLARGANPQVVDEDGWNALHHAAYSGHVDAIPLLLDAGVVVNSRVRGNSTALHLAAGQNHQEVAFALIAQGAQLDFTDEYGRTPAEVARRIGHHDLAKRLDP